MALLCIRCCISLGWESIMSIFMMLLTFLLPSSLLSKIIICKFRMEILFAEFVITWLWAFAHSHTLFQLTSIIKVATSLFAHTHLRAVHCLFVSLPYCPGNRACDMQHSSWYLFQRRGGRGGGERHIMIFRGKPTGFIA